MPIKNFKPIPAGDWIIHVVNASREENGAVTYGHEAHTVVGWGTENGCTLPFYWDKLVLSSVDEIEWYGTDAEGAPYGTEWVVLPRGTYPDRDALLKGAKYHLKCAEAEAREAAKKVRRAQS
ncbi:hypothetical protein [Microbacterium sp. GXF6406]